MFLQDGNFALQIAQGPGGAGVEPAELLVDIQTRMQQGKGPGYERWAKAFNLKQMTETVLYLQEHDLLYYPDLTKK